MKKIDLGQTITILANIGVIAGIAFLAVEIRQNNQLLRAEAIGTLLDTRMVRAELQLANPELSALIYKNQSDESLSEQDIETLNALHTRSLLGWQKDYFLFREGILDEDYMMANVPLMKIAFRRGRDQYGHMQHWQDIWSDVAHPAFRAFIEQCVISDCQSIPR